MNVDPMRRLCGLVSVAVLAGAGTLGSAAPAQAVPGSATATGLTARLTTGGEHIRVTAAEARHPGSTTKVGVPSARLGDAGRAAGLRADASGADPLGTTRSAASLDLLDLDSGVSRLRTEAVRASCEAEPGKRPTASVKITEGTFTVAGLPTVKLASEPAPDTLVPLPGGLGTVFLNEQHEDENGSLTVNALRLELAEEPGGAGSGTVTGGTGPRHRGTAPWTGGLTVASVHCDAGEVDEATVEATVRDATSDEPLSEVFLEATRLDTAPADAPQDPKPDVAKSAEGAKDAEGTAGSKDARETEDAEVTTAGAVSSEGTEDASGAGREKPGDGEPGQQKATTGPTGGRQAGAKAAFTGLLATDCATGPSGACTLESLDPGRYRICVTVVPTEHRLPAEPCREVTVAAGESAKVGPFHIPRSDTGRGGRDGEETERRTA